MEKINDLFENELSGVIHAYPSIYTKDDVSELLSKLRTAVLYKVAELKPTVGITELQFQEFRSAVTNALEQKFNRSEIDVFDYSSAEFSIGYNNTIEIECMDFNSDAVIEELEDILLDQFQQHFDKLITDKDENADSN